MDKNDKIKKKNKNILELNHTHEEGDLKKNEDRKCVSEEKILHDLEHEYGIPHSHDNDNGHSHGHTHSHTQTKAVVNRLSRAIGHLSAVKRMVESGRDCSEVLVQLAAVRSAINNTGKIILKDHIEHCIIEAMEEGDEEAIEMLLTAIDRFMN